MKQPHKHRDLIIAWANGENIQYKEDNEWVDRKDPCWCNLTEYRIKPEVVRYRVACFKDGSTVTADNNSEVKEYETDRAFIKWLTDWIEVEV
jgi:hypothetical protein